MAEAEEANVSEELSVKEIREAFKAANPKFYERYVQIDDSDEFFRFMHKPIRSSIRVNLSLIHISEPTRPY